MGFPMQDLSYQRPACIGKPIYQFSDPNSPTITNVPAVFAIPADGTIGTCGRNAFRGPHIVQWDFNLNKTTKITERISLQLRFEIFNLLNRANFNTPNLIAYVLQAPPNATFPEQSPTAGQITSTSTTSRQIQFGLKLLW